MIPLIQNLPAPSAGADYSFLLKRLENAVIQDADKEKTHTVLQKKEVWETLSLDQAIQWAGLCQIAGLMDTALDIYQGLVKKSPSFQTAWKNYIDLLDILDKRPILASVVQQAKKNLPEDLVDGWIKTGVSAPDPTPGQLSFESTPDPFVEMQTRQKLLEKYLALFSGRSDVFARQWADRKTATSGYVPVRRPMELSDLEDHLKGVKTLGFYLMNTDARVCCGVIDADLGLEFRKKNKDAATSHQIKKEQAYMASRIHDASQILGLTPVIEVSGGKGFHFWYFMDRPLQASLVRRALQEIVHPLSPDLTFFDLEIFPKQDHLTGKGLGNLVKLPLGIHRLSGKQSFFPACSKKDPESQLAFIGSVKKSPAEVLEKAPEKTMVQNLVLHPKMKTLSDKYPGLMELERCCPPVGRILASMRDKTSISAREEQILFQTLGFLPDAKKILHYLTAFDPEYNPHLVDYKLSRLRGTPLGCRRIHSLTGFTRDYCDISPDSTGYLHPLIHLTAWQKIAEKKTAKCQKIENLADAVENMKAAIIQLETFLS